MTSERAAKEVHGILAKYFKCRRDLGFFKSIFDLVLEPQNPFEPETRRGPRKDFVLVAVLLGLPMSALVYFNFWL